MSNIANSPAVPAKYSISSTPHVKDKSCTSGIMRDVLIALTPAALMGIYYFGLDAVITIAVCVLSCVLFEYLYQRIMKRKIIITDYSAAVTGLLLAINLPASKNIGVAIAGSFFAIVLIKQLFGGIGMNFVNPALGARAFLLLSYPTAMLYFPEVQRNFLNLGAEMGAVHAVSGATPLALLKQGIMPESADYINALIGFHKGSLGETCAIALILGGIYLIIRKVISWRIPVSYVLSAIIMSFILGRGGQMMGGAPLYEVLTGGLLIGAIFMATDYTTSPVTPLGQIIMGIGCGVITVFIRVLGGYPEGVSFAILLMNLATPLIDRFTRPKVFGKKKKKAEAI
ncbi:MAG: RnfABCDGE type electron transport complex subunit D [Clostridiales bacterium]|jgi:electron transport complex protein RnfD|nr:RnfABCDGE type electron transport complex subunit D [Clostridiales bacterium]